jgi:arginase family enzyme
MELVCPPWIRVVRSDNGRVLLEDVSLHCSGPTEPLVASLLEELREPVDVAELMKLDGEAISENLLTELLQAGLLMKSGGPSQFAGLLVPFEPTFLSCPASAANNAQISIIGMPCEAQSITGSGPGEGPAALRVASSFTSYRVNEAGVPLGFFDYASETQILEGVSLRDLGDIYMPKGEAAESPYSRLSHVAFLCRETNSFPLILGGDHSLTYAAVRGLADEPIDILHMDAHSDIMDIESTLLPSSGTVVRALLREKYVHRIVTVGLRGVLQIQQQSLRDGHTIISARRFREVGPAAIAGLLSSPCYISLDIDVLDPAVAPGTNLPVPAGLTIDEVIAILRAVASRVKVIGADIVEVSPRHDLHLRTARLGVELSLRLLAESFIGLGEYQNGELAAAVRSR